MIANIHFLFIITWFLFFIVFPLWYLPIPNIGRFCTFTAFIIYFSINGWLLYKWNKEKSIGEKIDIRKNNQKIGGEDLIFVIICLICSFIQIFMMRTLTIIHYDDESYHALIPSLPIDIIEHKLGFSIMPIAWITVLFLCYIFWTLKRKENIKFLGKYKLLFIFMGIFFLYIYFFLLTSIKSDLITKFTHPTILLRFPPLGKTLTFFAYSLFGINEFASRIQSFVFCILSSIFIYRLVNLFGDKKAALLSASMFLFLPPIFYYSRLCFLDLGLIFFFISTVFYFFSYLRTKRHSDALMMIYLLNIGVLYKVTFVVIFLILGFYLLLSLGRKFFVQLGSYFKLFWFGAVPAIPWLIINYNFSGRVYYFVLSNFDSLSDITFLFKQIPFEISYPIFVLFLIGAIYCLLKQRNALTYFSLLWFILFYIFINGDYCRADIRLSLPFYPAMVMITAQFLSSVFNLISKKIFWYGYSITVGYLFILVTIINFASLLPKYTISTDLKTGYLPTDKFFSTVRDKITKGSRIFLPDFDGSAFYLRKYKLRKQYVCILGQDMNTEEKLGVKKLKSLDEFLKFCYDNDFHYVGLIYAERFKSSIKENIIQEITLQKHAKFKLMEIFQFGENKIILCEVRR